MVTDPVTGQVKYTSYSDTRDCPGQTMCTSDTTDPSLVFYQEMSTPGQTITTRLRYCDRKSVLVRDCYQNEVAMALQGIGPIITDIEGDVTCKCSSPLVLHRVFPAGMYFVRQFTCGKPTCNVNSSKPPVCERISYSVWPQFGLSTEQKFHANVQTDTCVALITQQC